ncbi:hypothetical protein BGZ72_005720 [Mortierella alpina]|nr:hypothetical protein BGZ72_005720 [Mortierella alpina]
MAASDWMEEAEPPLTFDSIDVADFKSGSFWAHLQYIWVWIMFIGATFVFCGEIWTCTILLVYGPTWSTSSAMSVIDISIARWVFAASILLTSVLLVLAFRTANRAVKSRVISLAVSNKIASEFYRLQGYNYFCFIEKIRDSNKLHGKLSLLVVFQLKGWRFLAIQTPRQIINIMTLYAFMSAIEFDIDHLGAIGQNFPELENTDVFTFCVMIFTSVMFICSVIATFAAMVLWVPLSTQIQGSLKSFVYRRMDKRIDDLVKKTSQQYAKRVQLCEQRQVSGHSDDAGPGSGSGSGSGGTGSTPYPQSPSSRPNARRQKPTLPNIDIILANSGEDARRPSKTRNGQQFYQQQQHQLALETDHSSSQLQCRPSLYLQPDQYYYDPFSVYPSPASSSQQLLEQASVTELSRYGSRRGFQLRQGQHEYHQQQEAPCNQLSRASSHRSQNTNTGSPILQPCTVATVTSPVLISARHSMRREQPQLQFYQNGALSHQHTHFEPNQDYLDAYPRTPRFAPDYSLGEAGLESWRVQHGFPAGEGLECTSPTDQQFMGSCRPDSGVLPEMTGPYNRRTTSLESERESFSKHSQAEQDTAVPKINSLVYQPGKTEIEQYDSLFKGIAESHQRVKANRSKGTSRTFTRSYSADPLGVMDPLEQQSSSLAAHSLNDTARHQERYLPTPDSLVAPSSRLDSTQDPASYDDLTCPFIALDPPNMTFMGSAAPSPTPSRSSSAATSPCLSQRMLSHRQVNPTHQQQGSSSPSPMRVSTTPLRKLSDASVSATQVAMLLGNSSLGPSRPSSIDGNCELDDLRALRIDDMIEDLTASLQTTPRSSVTSIVQAPLRTTSPSRVPSPSFSSYLKKGEFLNNRTDGAGTRTLTSAGSGVLDSGCKMSPVGGSLRTGNSLFEGQKRDTNKFQVKNGLSNQDGKKTVQRVEAGEATLTDGSASEYDSDDGIEEEVLEEKVQEVQEGQQGRQKQNTAHAKTQVYQQPKRSWMASTSALISTEQVGSRPISPVFRNRAAGSSTTSLTNSPATANFAATTPRPMFYQTEASSMSRTSLELESWGESSLSLAKKSIELARASIDRPRTPMERSGLSVELLRRWEN